jgi:hypothetical protein
VTLSTGWRIAAITAVALAVFYGGFEFGRASAGFSLFEAMSARLALSGRNRALAKENESLRHRVATAEVSQKVDRQAQTDARRMMGTLEAETARQQQELQFYRGLVARQYGSGTLRVQEVQVRAAEEGRNRILITLVQAATRDTVANGTVTLMLDGATKGAARRLALADVEAGHRASLPFSLRFFQQLAVNVALPADFEPETIVVECRLARAAEPVRESFPWHVEGDVEAAEF